VRPARDLDRPDRGAVALLVLLVALAVSGAVLVATVQVADVLVDADRARTAADAAALAGVVHGRDMAERVAAENGGVIVSWSSTGTGHADELRRPATIEVTIEVRVGNAVANARATNAP
jgi:hypothetical protein